MAFHSHQRIYKYTVTIELRACMHFVGQIVKVHIFYNEFAMLSKFLMFSVISETYCIKLALMFFSSIETMIQRIHEKSLRGNFNSAATVVCIFLHI